jgi:hypothetical protein
MLQSFAPFHWKINHVLIKSIKVTLELELEYLQKMKSVILIFWKIFNLEEYHLIQDHSLIKICQSKDGSKVEREKYFLNYRMKSFQFQKVIILRNYDQFKVNLTFLYQIYQYILH